MLRLSIFFYNLFIQGYALAIRIASVFNAKAKKWIAGRRGFPTFDLADEKRVWVHCASLGEFEQARPLIEKIKQVHPKTQIIISFFSPSGYEVRKNQGIANAIVYLPLDTKTNAVKFLDALKPDLILFVKYEFWYHFLNESKKRNIPLVLFSAVFRKNQLFFHPLGMVFRKMLSFYSNIFVQDLDSQRLLNSISIKSEVASDTRFDRVLRYAQERKRFPLIDQFSSGYPLLIAGSTWPKDEALLVACIQKQILPGYKFIIAPHELSVKRLNELKQSCSLPALFYSELNETNAATTKVVIIDNYGMLASLYSYSRIVYIGGGFDAGIHNVLEAAVYGQPTIFGSHFNKSLEAKALISLGAAFSICDFVSLRQVFTQLIENGNQLLTDSSAKAKNYVVTHSGGSEQIYSYLHQQKYM